MATEEEISNFKELEEQRTATKEEQERNLTDSFKNNRKSGRENVANIHAVKDAISIFSKINLEKDVFYFLVIVLSVLADIFSIIPFIGSIFSIVFSIFFFFCYLMIGHYKQRAFTKAIISGGSFLGEIIGFQFSVLPFFTVSAFVNYGLTLLERKK